MPNSSNQLKKRPFPTDLEESVKDSRLIVIAIPTAFVTDVCKKLKGDGITNFTWYVVGDGPDYDDCVRQAKHFSGFFRSKNSLLCADTRTAGCLFCFTPDNRWAKWAGC